jgi:hypothetical protein
LTVRVLAVVEGDSEQAFVDRVLAPYLSEWGVVAAAEKIAKPGEKGGFTSNRRLRRHVLQRLLGDPSLVVTTMVDLYGPLRPGGFPGFQNAPQPNAPYERVAHLEAAFRDDLAADLGDDRRFIPHLQLHEFETLILVDPRQLDWMYIEERHAVGIAALVAEVAGLAPELINERPESAPSKRITRHLPDYSKVLAASEVAGRIGMAALKARCPHFGAWVERLEALGGRPAAPLG